MDELSQSDRSMRVVRVYRLKWYRFMAALFFLVLSCTFVIGTWRELILGAGEVKPLQMAISALLLIIGVLWTASTFKARVILYEDAIESVALRGRKALRFRDIRGRREYVVRSGGPESVSTRYLKLEPNDDLLPALEFEKYFTFDTAFYEWFNKLPDLAELDAQKAKSSNLG